MMYCIVKNGVPTELVNLRNEVNGVFGFHKLTDEEKKKHGWYPTVVTEDDFDPMLHKKDILLRFNASAGVVNVRYRSTPLQPSEIRKKKLEKGFIFTHESVDYEVKCSDSSLAKLQSHIGDESWVSGDRQFLFNGKVVGLNPLEYKDLMSQISQYLQECFDVEIASL